MQTSRLAIAAVSAVLAGTAAAQQSQHHLYTVGGDASNDLLGFRSAAAAGDVDGDGYADFVAGAVQRSAYSPGYARVYSGRTGLPLFTFHGVSSGDAFGYAAGAGDVNRDGHADVIVGATERFG